ncbi:toll/interleukin-1 receptor domain-containing protein [Bosea sp. NPDC003192]|uniref:toll/interleukin-1 receptor domain-containing protein n=1 Tax=Bosea sp. NPDC003192 TaxID=3390551 RepID=UPI003CFD9ED1
MSKVFICYRRSDAPDAVDRITDRLSKSLSRGELFRDVNSIPFGSDLRRQIENSLKQCKIFLLVIGPDWLNALNKIGGRRIDDPADFVRIEIETAISLRLIIIPILIGDANMPVETDLPASMKEIPYLLALRIRRDPDFDTDIEKLKTTIGRNIPNKIGILKIIVTISTVIIAILSMYLAYYFIRDQEPIKPPPDPNRICDDQRKVPFVDTSKNPPIRTMICP